MKTIPVLGVWQPYASLVAIGAKPWETRHFAPPARLLGKRVAVQATLRRPTIAEVYSDMPVQIREMLGWGWEARVPYGAVICTAVISCGHIVRDHFDDGTVTLGDTFGHSFMDDGFGDYGIGRWCWKLEDVRKLAVPIPLAGKQGIGWTWTPDAVQWAALEAAA